MRSIIEVSNGPAPIDSAAVDAVLEPFGTSRTMPAEAYRSIDLFEWEQANLFSTTWLCAGRTDELLQPGQLRAIELVGESVLLARATSGEVKAFSNVCRHRGHPLAEVGEPVDARQIRCPYHSWAYRFDGSLRTAPTLTQTVDFDPSEWPLAPIAVEDWLGWLMINLDGNAPPAAATFGNLADELELFEPERLVRAARHDYEVDANWKLLTENYHECYHCASIHPALCEVTPIDSGSDLDPDGLWCGGTMDLKSHAETMSFDGTSGGEPFRRLDERRRRTVLYVGLFPNLLISAHPDYVMTHRLIPTAPDRTRVVCDWLFAPETLERPGFDPSYAVEFWDQTNWEDWTACERIQRATSNRGFAPGPLSVGEATIYQVLTMVGRAYRGEGLGAPIAAPRVAVAGPAP